MAVRAEDLLKSFKQAPAEQPQAAAPSADDGGGAITAESLLQTALENPPAPAGQPGAKELPPPELSFMDKAVLSGHDTVSERRMYLEKRYGKDSVRVAPDKDTGKDTLYLKKDGKFVRIPEDFGFLAGLAGQSPEIAGGVIGAAQGAGAGAVVGGPWGAFAGAVIGSGVGAVGGHALKNIGKQASGTFAQTDEQAKEGYVGSFEQGAVGEVGGRIVGKAVSKVLGGHLPRFITGATDESVAQTKKAWEGGALPHYASMAPDARKLARVEIDAEKLTGKYKAQAEKNQAYVLSQVRERLQESGMSQPMIESMMKDLADPHAPAFTGRQAGETIQKGVRAQAEMLEHHTRVAGETADKLLDARLANIDHIIDAHPAGMLADDTEAMISNARKTLGQEADKRYGMIHDALGGARVVPVAGVSKAAHEIIQNLPPSQVAALVRDMSKLAKKPLSPEDALLLKEFEIEPGSDMITLKQAQRARTKLFEKSGAGNLTRTSTQGEMSMVGHAIDDSIQAAAEDPMAGPAIKALNETDAWYEANIAKFKDRVIRKLVKDTKAGMAPDPQKIVSALTAPGNTARITQLRQVLGEPLWKRVQSTHLSTVMQRVSSTGEKGSRVVNGMKLLDHLEKRENALAFDTVHGPGSAEQMREIGRMTAARKGTLDVAALKDGDIKGALQGLRESEKRLDEYLKGNLLAELRDPTKTGEDVFRWAVEPGKESRVMAVAKAFGEDSQQMAELRQGALEMLARNASVRAVEEKGNRALTSAMDQFTKTQQELLFPNGLAGDIRALGDVIKFIYPFQSGASKDIGMAGMHAGAVLELPFRKRVYRQAVASIGRYIALHPTVARWIVTGRDANTPWIVGAATIVKQIVKSDLMIENAPDDLTQEVKREQDPMKQQGLAAAAQVQPEGGGGGPD